MIAVAPDECSFKKINTDRFIDAHVFYIILISLVSRGSKMNFDKSLLSGSTRMLVLSVLEQKDEYGWGIIMQLSERSDKTFEMKEGTLYPVLHSMETEGYITSYDQDTPAGRRRKYYHITEKGRKELESQKAQWQAFSGGVNKVLAREAFV